MSDAQLRWGLNDESNGTAPVGTNFFSAGRLANKGANHTVAASEWRQRDGHVAIEKLSASGSYVAASWAGLFQDTSGRPLTTGAVSGHQIVWDGGIGSVDREAGNAVIRWSGSATVVYYSGLEFFSLSDPVLTVTAGTGKLDATLSGYGSSQTDAGTWVALPATPVRLADLGPVDLGGEGGFSVAPAYRGVGVTLPAGSTPQNRTGPDWGAFPQSYVDFQVRSGLSSYWYSSGSSADARKVPQPLTVSYSADAPVRAPVPTPTARPVDVVSNAAIAAPSPAATTSVTLTAVSSARPVAVPAAPSRAEPSTTVASFPPAAPAPTVLALASAPASPAPAPVWPWVLGALALAASGLVAGRCVRPTATHLTPTALSGGAPGRIGATDRKEQP
ncbi:hypothetical protein P5P86_17255 [Nocardioides sp. BP30]|uniref:hypothetical protein n=1 Tax=Nocardioides sp. BP30 TaxID=3036374 RepID=UPI002468C0F5|nr:hypothetical protein [Nocardioides sp. BP30]WGL51693.1 hypothetical protein P5P86_17255 [Nocardioides sp. BP30]